MPLFQNSVLKKYLAHLDPSAVQSGYTAYSAYFHHPQIRENIRNAKEEQFQEGFLRELFVKILGYTINPEPDFNLTTELKNIKDSKKTDGAILKDGKALAVIELKGTDTKDLDKIRDQAFNYKNNQPDCVYVLTSNFERLRFYIDNAVDFVEFNVLSMAAEDFRLLWLLLHRDQLLGGIPKKIKEESLLAEEQVTKQLYADYSAFKQELWQDMVAHNPGEDELTLYKKSQKLLDRFLFIFFAEDKGLLPPNSISEIVKHWKTLEHLDAYAPLYDRFKLYFGFLNTGRPAKGDKAEIHAYNGGLFAPDAVLDGLTISDAVLEKHVRKLTEYDFESEVDTNILGHIFEHSLNDIENVRAQLAGQEVDKSKTKRKRDGVFYTPKYITKYIVDNTLGRLCREKKEEIEIVDEEFARGKVFKTKEAEQKRRAELKEKLTNYRNWLMQLAICDPACGSGAFLNQVLEFLMAEHHYLDELESMLFGSSIVFPNVEKHILENNIFGVDINEESVEIARLSLWLRTAKKGRKLSSLNANIKVGNSLIDDPAVAGDLAFSWAEQFPQVFAKGGFDVVVGNPPYVYGRENFNEDEKTAFKTKFKTAQYQINTYIIFIELSNNLIKPDGKMGLIVPNSWLMINSAHDLRNYLLEFSTVKKIVNLKGYSFEQANVETIILVAEKSKKNDESVEVYLNEGSEFNYSHNRELAEFKKNPLKEFDIYADDYSISLINKITSNSIALNDIVEIKAGLKAYQSGKGKPKQTKEIVENRPFDYNFKYNDDTHMYLEGKDVCRYGIDWSGQYLWYGPHLAEPRIFEGEKIIVREITGKYPNCMISTYTEKLYLFNLSNIAILPKKNSQFNLLFILGLLNSKVLSFYFLNKTAKSVRKMFPKIILSDLRRFPIKITDSSNQLVIINAVSRMLAAVQEMSVNKNTFLKYISVKLNIDKASRNLENWPELDFKGFLGELAKAKVKLSLSEEAEWMAYFNEQKAKAQALQSEITRIDKEIDALVYELYGLTEEEIRIVEGGEG